MLRRLLCTDSLSGERSSSSFKRPAKIGISSSGMSLWNHFTFVSMYQIPGSILSTRDRAPLGTQGCTLSYISGSSMRMAVRETATSEFPRWPPRLRKPAENHAHAFKILIVVVIERLEELSPRPDLKERTAQCPQVTRNPDLVIQKKFGGTKAPGYAAIPRRAGDVEGRPKINDLYCFENELGINVVPGNWVDEILGGG